VPFGPVSGREKIEEKKQRGEEEKKKVAGCQRSVAGEKMEVRKSGSFMPNIMNSEVN